MFCLPSESIRMTRQVRQKRGKMNERAQTDPGAWEPRDARYLRRWKQAGRLKGDLLVAFLLIGFAFWINRDVEIKGLYMDDLYLWSCYGEQSFWNMCFL